MRDRVWVIGSLRLKAPRIAPKSSASARGYAPCRSRGGSQAITALVWSASDDKLDRHAAGSRCCPSSAANNDRHPEALRMRCKGIAGGASKDERPDAAAGPSPFEGR